MAYIGNSPGNASQRVITQKVATAGQTRFASDSGYATGYVDVIVNGLDLVAGVDFNETGDGINIDIVEPCAADDNVKIIAWIPRGLSDGYTKPEANALLALKADLVAGKIPSSQLPAYVDDVLEYANLAAFPATGSASIIYVAQDTNNCYRWSGSAYIVLTDLSSYYTKTQSDAKYVGKDSSTGAALMPVGTTAQRPATPSTGMYRMNSTTGAPEWYNTLSSTWLPFSDPTSYPIEVLLVAGGASGGTSGTTDSGGGGGAGGLVAPQTFLAGSGVGYSAIVGAGGAGFQTANSNGNSGSNTSFSGVPVVAIGGGYGCGESGYRVAGSGGSGGGAGGYSGAAGSGTSGQGNAGAPIGTQGSGSSGGGGGAGAAATNMSGGNGSNAYSTWASATSSGSNGYYAGGGGGAGDQRNTTNGGGAGAGGGGTGASATGGQTGQSGAVNTGGGGGGGAGSSYTGITSYCGAGGSGIVILRYIGSQRGTGGTVTQSGGYTYHTFTSSGTFTA